MDILQKLRDRARAHVQHIILPEGSDPRTLEAAVIMTGVMAVMALIRLDADSPIADALVEMHDASFLLGPAFMSAMNALLLGSIMLRGRLVPRVIPTVGLIGGPLLLLSSFGVVLGFARLSHATARATASSLAASSPTGAYCRIE